MSILNVNATRMELNKLKNRLLITRKGHKLLKNKTDGLLQKFLNISKQTIALRKQIKEKIAKINLNLELSKIKTSKEEVNSTLLIPSEKLKIRELESNILGVAVSSFKFEKTITQQKTPAYSFFSNSSFLDVAVRESKLVFFELITLSEKEKSLLILSSEIEKTRRKVNAIENILIPNFEDTIKYISLKLEENERNMTAALRTLEKKQL